MRKHIDILAICFGVYGLYQFVVGLMVVGVYVGAGALMGIIGAMEHEDELMIVGGAFGFGGMIAGVLILAFTLPVLLAGLGVYRRRQWGRILAFIVAALNIMSVPFGTALGVYAFVVLLDADVGRAFEEPTPDW